MEFNLTRMNLLLDFNARNSKSETVTSTIEAKEGKSVFTGHYTICSILQGEAKLTRKPQQETTRDRGFKYHKENIEYRTLAQATKPAVSLSLILSVYENIILNIAI